MAEIEDYEPDEGPNPQTDMVPPEDVLPPANENDPMVVEVPADWVEGYDDNSASERGSHWEDE